MCKILVSIIFVLLLCFQSSFAKSVEIDTPLKALIVYFPSPAVMRCLNHSEIPKKFRKAYISRHAKFEDKSELVENITVGTTGKKFTFTGSITTNSEITPLRIKGGPYFGLNKGGEIKSSLFGFENLLGLQGKVHIKDEIGNQKLNFETFLKNTKGRIGDSNYNLELIGQDKIINKQIKYFLRGYGKIGEDNISVKAGDIEKDQYEVYEKYGPVEVFTTVKVYD